MRFSIRNCARSSVIMPSTVTRAICLGGAKPHSLLRASVSAPIATATARMAAPRQNEADRFRRRRSSTDSVSSDMGARPFGSVGNDWILALRLAELRYWAKSPRAAAWLAPRLLGWIIVCQAGCPLPSPPNALTSRTRASRRLGRRDLVPVRHLRDGGRHHIARH